jgi:hypothetical protein
MPELAERQITERGAGVEPAQIVTPPAGSQLLTRRDDGAARRSLRDQIAKLERELASLFVSAYPRPGLEWRVPVPGGPRVLGVGELEELRDELVMRVEDARRTLRDRAYVERKNVDRIEEMLAEPERFKWVRISNADIGEPGCKYWHSRPRLGLIGMLLGWWRVKISSGCP